MSTTSKQLYLFLSACAGNWHNAVYIAVAETEHPGYLLCADRDAQPIVMAVEQFQRLTGEIIDPAECCGQLTDEGFRTLYAQYLLWHMPSADADSLAVLSQNSVIAAL